MSDEELESIEERLNKLLESEEVEKQTFAHRIYEMRRRRMTMLLYMGIISTFTAALGFFVVVRQTGDVRMLLGPVLPAQQDPGISEIRNEIGEVNSQLAIFDAKFKALSDKAPAQAAVAEVAEVKQQLERVDARLALLERAISNSPEKALSLPLIRKDIESVVRQQEWQSGEIRSLTGSIDSLRTLMITGLGALLLAGLTMLGNYWIGRGSKKNGEDKAD